MPKGSFCFLSCLCSFGIKNKLESHKRLCKNKNFCNITIPSGDTKILEFNQYQQSEIAPFIIYADLECLIETVDGCKNNPGNSATTKELYEKVLWFIKRARNEDN